MRTCHACRGEVQDTFRFCPHCGKVQRRKIVEHFRGHPDVGNGGLRVSLYLGETQHARFSVWHGEAAEAAISLDPEEMREYEKSRTPLLSLETQTPVRDFDIVAFSISFETAARHNIEHPIGAISEIG